MQNMVSSHLNLPLTSTSVAILDLKEQSYSLDYIKLQLSNRKHQVSHLIFKNENNYGVTKEESARMIKAVERCARLEKIEVDILAGILREVHLCFND